MDYVLGIDQGGSKTHAVIADETGKILGMGKSYGACHSSSSIEYAIGAVMEASEEAFKQCGLLRDDVTTIVGGLTGIDWDYEAELLENSIREYFPKADIKVVNDCIIAMRAASRRNYCGILCAGSGLNCAVQKDDECFVYGFYIPDEYQGGWSLGKKALQAVFDSEMGLLEKTSLTGQLLKYFHTKTVDELLYRRVKGKISSKEYLALPMILEEEAKRGDKVATDIWLDFGRTIVNFLAVRIKKMGIINKKVDIVLSGSIFKCQLEEFRTTIREEILKKMPNANIIESKYEPIIGAVLMGLQRLHGDLTDEIYENIRKSGDNYPVWRIKTVEKEK